MSSSSSSSWLFPFDRPLQSLYEFSLHEEDPPFILFLVTLLGILFLLLFLFFRHAPPIPTDSSAFLSLQRDLIESRSEAKGAAAQLNEAKKKLDELTKKAKKDEDLLAESKRNSDLSKDEEKKFHREISSLKGEISSWEKKLQEKENANTKEIQEGNKQREKLQQQIKTLENSKKSAQSSSPTPSGDSNNAPDVSSLHAKITSVISGIKQSIVVTHPTAEELKSHDLNEITVDKTPEPPSSFTVVEDRMDRVTELEKLLAARVQTAENQIKRLLSQNHLLLNNLTAEAIGEEPPQHRSRLSSVEGRHDTSTPATSSPGVRRAGSIADKHVWVRPEDISSIFQSADRETLLQYLHDLSQGNVKLVMQTRKLREASRELQTKLDKNNPNKTDEENKDGAVIHLKSTPEDDKPSKSSPSPSPSPPSPDKEQEISTLKSLNTTLQQEIDELKKSLQAAEDEAKRSNKTPKSAGKSGKAQGDQKDNIKRLISDTSPQSTSAESSDESLKQLREALQKAEGEKAAALTKFNSVEKEAEQMKRDSKRREDQVSDEISSLKSSLEVHKNKEKFKDLEIQTLQSEITAIQSTLNSSKASSQITLDSRERELQAMGVEISSLKLQIQQLKHQGDGVRKELEANNATMSQSVVFSKENQEFYETKIQNLKKEMEILQTKYDDANTEAKQKEKETEENQVKIQTLTSQLQSLKDKSTTNSTSSTTTSTVAPASPPSTGKGKSGASSPPSSPPPPLSPTASANDLNNRLHYYKKSCDKKDEEISQLQQKYALLTKQMAEQKSLTDSSSSNTLGTSSSTSNSAGGGKSSDDASDPRQLLDKYKNENQLLLDEIEDQRELASSQENKIISLTNTINGLRAQK